ncbi:Uncharacterized protein FWK35_00007346 [Aphis craccivora]|uniref:Uncharacterized protein n=1 Tax=Aphis craccivora TaxID=307492 RepID=A0A6G0Z9X5_APHCR|nr:Uncharacterized protein FWK35_00007346 [Aphis craccivora]
MCIIPYGAVGQNTSHNSMRFGIQSVGALSGRSSRINAATGERLTSGGVLMSYYKLPPTQGRSVRQPAPDCRRSPGLHAGYGAINHNQQTAGPVFCDGTGNESQATVDVATTAIINRKTSAGGSGLHNVAAYINTSAEHKITRPTRADLRGLGTTDYMAPCCSKTHPGQTCAVLLYGKNNKTSTKKIPQEYFAIMRIDRTDIDPAAGSIAKWSSNS